MDDSRTNRPAAVQPHAEALAFSRLAAFRTVRKHWVIAAGTAILISLGTTFYVLGQTQVFEAAATLQFDPNPPRPLGRDVQAVVDMGPGDYWNNREYYETQYKILQSMRVAIGTVRELDLQRDAAFLANAPPGTNPAVRPRSVEEAAEILRFRLHVQPVKESRLAVVKLEDTDPARAQRVLSALVDVYVQQNLDDAVASTNSAVEWLRTQLDKIKTDLESSEMALHDYKQTKNILSVAFDDQTNMLREELRQLSEALTHVRTKRQEVAARRGELFKVDPNDPQRVPAAELLSSPLLAQLRQRYEDATRDRDAQIGRDKGLNHPDVREAEKRVASARAAVLAEIRNIQGALDRDLAAIVRQEGGLLGLVEAAKKQALDLNLLEIEYNRLRRNKEHTEKLYTLVLERTKETDLQRMLRVNNIRIVDRPLLPRVPIRPRVPLSIGVGVVSGLALGVLLAITRAMLDRTIKTPDDVDVELGEAFIGLLPEMSQESGRAPYYGRRRRRPPRQPASGVPELVVAEHPSSGIAESARVIRTNLMFMAPDKPYRTLLITSPSVAEGKTTVAFCIAIAFAQAGNRVALVDCDLRRPRVHKILRKPGDVGVTTALLDDATLMEDIAPTAIPNLSVLPAGPLPPNPAELFHSARFRAVLARLAESFDRVVIDSPPVVPVTDATVLSTLVDATVFVVRAFATRKDVARFALRSLRDVGSKIAGVVINAVNLERHEYKYYHYYYRRHGYYESPYGTSDADRTSSSAPAS